MTNLAIVLSSSLKRMLAEVTPAGKSKVAFIQCKCFATYLATVSRTNQTFILAKMNVPSTIEVVHLDDNGE